MAHRLSPAQHRYFIHGFVLTMIIGVLGLGNWAGKLAGSPAGTAAAAAPATSSAPPSENRIVARVIPTTADTSITGAKADKLSDLRAIDLPKPAAAPAVPQKPAPVLRSYVVQDGDNPYDLAIKLGISEETLLAANGLGADSTIAVGQKLLVPPVSGIVVTTQPGAKVSALADQFKISITKLIAVNHLDPTVQALVPGEPLVLPDVAPP
ncbi:MAG: LysM peptidoglycan-binding domain-containing protein, partial [Chloroflexota bacterium]|nr:LysM peptidoglycan-binding domain-containing protein [Chloroflexota bacterium]